MEISSLNGFNSLSLGENKVILEEKKKKKREIQRAANTFQAWVAFHWKVFHGQMTLPAVFSWC